MGGLTGTRAKGSSPYTHWRPRLSRPPPGLSPSNSAGAISIAAQELGMWSLALEDLQPQHLVSLRHKACSALKEMSPPRSLPFSLPPRIRTASSCWHAQLISGLAELASGLVLHVIILILFDSHNSPAGLKSYIHRTYDTMKFKGINWPTFSGTLVSELEFDFRSLLPKPGI